MKNVNEFTFDCSKLVLSGWF